MNLTGRIESVRSELRASPKDLEAAIEYVHLETIRAPFGQYGAASMLALQTIEILRNRVHSVDSFLPILSETAAKIQALANSLPPALPPVVRSVSAPVACSRPAPVDPLRQMSLSPQIKPEQKFTTKKLVELNKLPIYQQLWNYICDQKDVVVSDPEIDKKAYRIFNLNCFYLICRTRPDLAEMKTNLNWTKLRMQTYVTLLKHFNWFFGLPTLFCLLFNAGWWICQGISKLFTPKPSENPAARSLLDGDMHYS